MEITARDSPFSFHVLILRHRPYTIPVWNCLLVWNFFGLFWSIAVSVYPVDFGLTAGGLLLELRVPVRPFSINTLGLGGFLRALQPLGAAHQSH